MPDHGASGMDLTLSRVEQRDETPSPGRAVPVVRSLSECLAEPRLPAVDQEQSAGFLSCVGYEPFEPVEVGHETVRIGLLPDKAHRQIVFKLARADDVSHHPAIHERRSGTLRSDSPYPAPSHGVDISMSIRIHFSFLEKSIEANDRRHSHPPSGHVCSGQSKTHS